VRLIDAAGADKNLNLGYGLGDSYRATADCRSRARTLLLHCVQAQSRTPTAAPLNESPVGELGLADAFAQIKSVLTEACPIGDMPRNPSASEAVADDHRRHVRGMGEQNYCL